MRKGNSAAVKLVYLLKYKPNGERTSCENSEEKVALTQSMDCSWIAMSGKSIAMAILEWCSPFSKVALMGVAALRQSLLSLNASRENAFHSGSHLMSILLGP